MRYLERIIALLLLLPFLTLAQPGNTDKRKIQVAILFDTSNSMDGLIDQAKARIWTIVNDLSSLRHSGEIPLIEIALYDYGNSGINAELNYVRKQIELTSDLDVISEKLFGLRTNGGLEYCGAVIGSSISELAWTAHPQDLRIIFIAGNEPFNQGPVNYKEIMEIAVQKDITVNTIYCGNYDQGMREFWYDGAQLGKGDYFNIDSDKTIVHINSPYDDKINAYNDSLNKTYYGYGRMGISGKSNQVMQDANAESSAGAVKTERAIAKSKENYSNASWDLIDAVKNENKDIRTIKDEELPEEFRGKTTEEKEKMIEAKKLERDTYQKKISELAIERQKFIDEEQKKLAEKGEVNDFGTSIQKSILKRAEAIGYAKQSTN